MRSQGYLVMQLTSCPKFSHPVQFIKEDIIKQFKKMEYGRGETLHDQLVILYYCHTSNYNEWTIFVLMIVHGSLGTQCFFTTWYLISDSLGSNFQLPTLTVAPRNVLHPMLTGCETIDWIFSIDNCYSLARKCLVVKQSCLFLYHFY